MTYVRRLAAAALVLATLSPVHRLLDPARTGPAGAATRDAAETAWSLGLSGTIIILALAWVGTRMLPPQASAPRLATRVWRTLTLPGPATFAVGVGLLAGLGAGRAAWRIHGRSPTSVDEMAQLLHAAALTGGRMTVPLGTSPASWIVQNGVVTDGGWASIYPPLHTLFLALGLACGAAWLVGPLMTGIATAAITRSVERLYDRDAGRATGLLLCISPLWLLLGATHLSHATAAAGLALLLLACSAARDGASGRAGLLWALGAGASAGIAIAARPWIGLACASAIMAATWGPVLTARGGLRAWSARLSAVVAGGAPFALLLFWWNQTLFGHPLRLGYTTAFGPAHGLGFHVDPWGNRYGIVEAIAYTGADVLQIGTRLLETPLPATLIVALGLTIAGRERRGAWLPLGSWLAAGVAANALYWHHGIHFGPRMMFELVPVWAAMVAITVVEVSRAPASSGWRFGRWVVAMSLVGGVILSATTLKTLPTARSQPGSLAWLDDLPDRLSEAQAASSVGPGTPASVVFVHGSWASRVGARLAASGMRRDSIETALRRNDLCRVDRYARWRTSGSAGSAPDIDFEPLPGTPPRLEIQALSPGNMIRIDLGSAPDPTCLREMRADRLGTFELELVAWRAPALQGDGYAFARDLGPGGNLRVIEGDGGDAWVLVPRAEGEPVLLPYRDGMQLLWGGPAN